MLFTHGAPRDPPARDHRPVDGDQYSRHGRDFRAMEGITRHGTKTLQHTTKRILGASGGCESRLLKNTKERSSPSLCWQVVKKLTSATRFIPVIATWRRSTGTGSCAPNNKHYYYRTIKCPWSWAVTLLLTLRSPRYFSGPCSFGYKGTGWLVICGPIN